MHRPNETLAVAEPETLSVRIHRPQDDLTDMEADWRRLEEDRLVPAVASNAHWVIPALRHLGRDAGDALAMTVHSADAMEGACLFELDRRRWIVPANVLTSWDNKFFFSGTPLVSRAKAHRAVAAVAEAAAGEFGARAMLFRNVPADGAFIEIVRQASRGRCEIVDRHQRAALKVVGTYDDWFAGNFSRKRRKEYRRLRNRLAELGDLRSEALRPDEPLQAWIDAFLKLETAGWKGRRGTALACGDAMSEFATHMLHRHAGRGNLRFWRLTLDGAPLAMLFAMVSHRFAGLGKIAYDETHARSSPGVLLLLDATRDLIERGDVDLADSNAVPDHPMIDHIWRDRLAICDLLVATPGTSAGAFQMMVRAERLRREMRAGAKSIYHRYLKG